MSSKKYFTVVFEGDITKLPFNPLTAETPYGRPFASGMGNALELLNQIEEFADAMQMVIDVLPAGIVITGRS